MDVLVTKRVSMWCRECANRGVWSLVAVLASAFLGAAGCADQMEGPEPNLDGEPGAEGDEAFASPGFGCNAQSGEESEVDPWITIRGESFAPVVAGSLEEESVEYPTVELRRTAAIDGEFDGERSTATLEAADEGVERPSRIEWVDETTLRMRVDAGLELEAGVYDVHVTNPSGESVRKKHAFGLVSRPTVEAVVPGLACTAQGEREIEIRGGPFLTEGDELPGVRVGDETLEPAEASGCEELHETFGEHEVCERLRVTLPDRDETREVGAKDVEVTNLEPANCSSRPARDDSRLEVVPPPEIESVSPVPVCSKQKTYERFRIDGSGFVRIDHDGERRRPSVEVGGRNFEVQSLENCQSVESAGGRGTRSCETAYIRISAGVLDEISQGDGSWEPLSGHLDAGADAGTTDAGSGDATRSDVATSDAGTADAATVDASASDAGSDAGGRDAGSDGGDDTGLPETDGPRPNTELTSLPMTLINPEPVGCRSAEAELPVVPPPMVHDVTPDPFCNIDQDGEQDVGTTEIAVDGAGFLQIEVDSEDAANLPELPDDWPVLDRDDGPTSAVPVVELAGETFEATGLAGCTDLEIGDERVESCSRVIAEVPEGAVGDGSVEVSVRNPPPADCRSEGSAPARLTPLPGVDGVQPQPVCTADGARQVTIRGEDFFVVDGERPEVAFGMFSTRADRAEDCSEVGIDDRSEDVLRCETLQATIPAGQFSPDVDGAFDRREVGVTNPGATGCSSPERVALRTVDAPDLAGITEEFACLEESERSFTIRAEDREFLEITDGAAGTMGANPMRPTVEVGGQLFPADAMDECSSVDDSPVGETRLCETLTFTVPAEQVEAGTHRVRVHQPPPARCAGSDTLELVVEPAPTVAAVSEQPVCAAQIDNDLTLTGEFLIVDGHEPTVRIGNYTASDDEVTPTGCSSVDAIDGRSVERCGQLEVQTDAGDLEAGQQLVTATNPLSSDPSSQGCTSRDDTRLRVEPAPTLTRVQPEPICMAQGTNAVSAVGTGLLSIDYQSESTRRPEVTFLEGGSPLATYSTTDVGTCQARPIDGDNPRVKSCQTADFEIPVEGSADGLPTTSSPTTYQARVTNPGPAGCQSPTLVDYTVVPPPSITGIEPEVTCLQDRQQTYTLSSAADQPFLAIDDSTGTVRMPEAKIDGERYPTSVDDLAQDCTAMNATPTRPDYTVYTCPEIEVTLQEGELGSGDHEVRVHNPTQADCESSNAVNLRVEQAPVVTDVAPSPVCTDQNAYTDVRVEGRNFMSVDGDLPDVTIGGVDVQTSDVVDSTCSGTATPGVRECTELIVEVAEDALAQGALTDHRVVVTNPDPVDCESSENVYQADAPPPTIGNAAVQETCPSSDPNRMIVEAQDDDRDYYEMGGELPRVTIEGQDTAAPALIGTWESVAPSSASPDRCPVLSVELEGGQSDAAGGRDYTIEVDNRGDLQCSVTRTLQVGQRAAERPTVTDIQPARTCASGGVIEIDGENFQNTPSVELGGVEADSVTFHDSENLTASWNGTSFPEGGSLDLTVTNPNGCQSDPYGEDVEVLTGPLAVYLDPAVHYREISLSGRLYFTNGDPSDVTGVQIRDPSGNVHDLTYSSVSGEDGQLRVTLPDNSSLPEGMYDVRVTEEVAGVDCGAWRDELLEVVGTTEIAVEGIEPEYGSELEDTSLQITATDPPPSGQTQFEPTPRVYLNPTSSGSSATATELTGTTFSSATELEGIVEGTEVSPGDYQVVVVNPDSTVGVAPDEFTVTRERTPVIDSVSPGTWETPESAVAVTIEGENFRIDAGQADPTPIEVTCDDGAAPSLADGTITIDSESSTSVELTVDTRDMNRGDACELRLTNQDNTYATYSPIATVNPAYKFISFEDGPAFQDPRRWPAMDSGEPSRQQRFVYAFGGDNGAGTLGPADVRATGEMAPIDRFGEPGEWRYLPNDLPGDGRTFARSTRIRDFIYLIGGHDGTSVTDEILRANVLDPTHTPEITGLEFNFTEGSGGGLEPGVYYYRVSAVHPTSSDHNPGGETLPSSVQPVYVPDLQDYQVSVTLEWSTFTNVDEYRVYRSPSPDLAAGEEERLTTTGAGTTSVTDDGSMSTSGEAFVPVGSLGEWNQVGTLNTPRARHGVQGVIDPSDPDTAYIYVLGGQDTTGTVTYDSIEKITILGDADVKRAQSVDAVATSSRALSAERTEIDAMVATPANSSNLSSGEAYLYSIGGEEPGGGGTTTEIDYWPLAGGTGDLGAIRDSTNMQRARSGFAATIANNVSLAFGGHNGAPDSNGDISGEIETDGNLPGWSSQGGISMSERHRLGRTSFVGFLYLGGGVGTGGAVLETMEYAVIGTTRR